MKLANIWEWQLGGSFGLLVNSTVIFKKPLLHLRIYRWLLPDLCWIYMSDYEPCTPSYSGKVFTYKYKLAFPGKK